MAFKRYDLAAGAGLVLAELLRNGHPAELVSAYELVREDERLRAQRSSVRPGRLGHIPRASPGRLWSTVCHYW